jgi:8-oxo-dGTP diphosphatase
MYCSTCAAELVEGTIEHRPRLVCPACGRVAYQQLKVGAGVLVEKEGKILLARRSMDCGAFPGTWNLPAGYCEADEHPAVTAAREAREETGLGVRVGRLLDLYYFDDDPRGNGLLLVYEAALDEQAGGAAPHGPSDEVSEAGFFSPENLPEPLCGAGHDRAILAWKARVLDRWQPGMAPRFCPHCGHPLAERLAFGRQRLACPACGYVDFRELKVGTSVIIMQEGRILLIRRKEEPGKGLWALPSGFVEWDEAPEEAACRECAEETGLVAGDLRLLDVSHYSDDFRGPGINLFYRAGITGGDLQAGDDAADARFFAREELPPRSEIAFQGHADLLMADGIWQMADGG